MDSSEAGRQADPVAVGWKVAEDDGRVDREILAATNAIDFVQAAAPAIRAAARLLRKFRASRRKIGAITHQSLRNARIFRDDANAGLTGTSRALPAKEQR